MAAKRTISGAEGSDAVAPKPLGDFSQVVVCVDSCTPTTDMHRIMSQWRGIEQAVRSTGQPYPDIRIGVTNQLLREQTNITDLDTLMAFRELKTGPGNFFRDNADALRHENTGPCRHFTKALIQDILPMRAFPVLDSGEPEEVLNMVKAVAYYVLHLEDQLNNKNRAAQWGEPPSILTANGELSYDDVKQNADAFRNVGLPRNFSGVHTSHALLTGIRATELWPWADAYFTDDPDRKTMLEDIHFNQADLSMIDLSRRLAEDPGTIDPKQTLFILVSRDEGLMREMVELTYGYRMEKVPADNSEYKADLERINELTAQIRETEDLQRRELKEHGVFVTDQLVERLHGIRQEREELKEKYEIPLRETGKRPGKGKKTVMTQLSGDDYDQHSSKGLRVKPQAFEDTPEVMVMPPHRFLQMMKGHLGELSQTEAAGASPDMQEALAKLGASLQLLQITEGNEMNDKGPEAAYKLGRVTRAHATQVVEEVDPKRKLFGQLGIEPRGEGWTKGIKDD